MILLTPEAESHHNKWSALEKAYAQAMWTWAEVETSIFTIYVAAIGALKTDTRPIRISFFKIQGFRHRLKKTGDAVIAKWGNCTPYAIEWEKLQLRCEKQRKKRNSIAHLSAHFYKAENKRQHHLYVLLPPFWHSQSPLTWKAAKADGIDSDKLIQFSNDWHSLLCDLNQFSMKIWNDYLSKTNTH